MKHLKLVIPFIFLSALTIWIVTDTSCSRDKCWKVQCHHGGVCKDGACSCASGYTGQHCDDIDSCAGITCANGGVCAHGVCQCPTGYEGPTCATVSRNKFLGNWTVFEKGSRTLPAQYDVSIVTGTNITDVYVRNFNNYFRTPIKGSISATGDTLTIPRQQYEGRIVEGKGYITSNPTYGQYGTIMMRYEVIDTSTMIANDYGYLNSSADPSMWNK